MKNEGKNKSDEGYQMIIPAHDVLKDDRWNAPKKFLDMVNVIKGDRLAFQKITKERYFVYPLNPALFPYLDIELTRKQDKELFKEVIASIPEGEDIECNHIIQVKSQGRCGAKSHLTEILKDIGVTGVDYLFCKFTKNYEDQGCGGWFVSALRNEDIKNIVEIEEKKNESKRVADS